MYTIPGASKASVEVPLTILLVHKSQPPPPKNNLCRYSTIEIETENDCETQFRNLS